MSTIVYRNEHGSLTIDRPAPRVVLLCLVGKDAGQFGDAPFKELAQDLHGDGSLELFAVERGRQRAIAPSSSAPPPRQERCS
jgi:hypothetical protein